MMRCEVCGSKRDVKPTIELDLCSKCYYNLRAEHVVYAEAQRRKLSTDAMSPVLATETK